MVPVNWLFTFSLILAAGAWHEIGRGIITDQGLDSKDERVGKRLDMGDKRNMAGHANDLHGKMSNEINMGNLLGHDWHLVEEQEREGDCPGTREKVENTELGNVIENFQGGEKKCPCRGMNIFNVE